MTPAPKSRRNEGITPLCFLCFFFLLSSSLVGAQSDSSNNQNDPNYYNRFSPSMAIIVVILIAALFLMGFFSIYIRHCSDSPSASARHLTAVASGRSRRGSRGLDRSVIDSFPTLEYSVVKVHKIGKGALECAVCLNEFEDTEMLRLIPKCDHVFHPVCIDEWLSSHTTCPVCRANLVPQPGESIHGVPEFNDDVEAQSDVVETECENPENNNANVNVNVSGVENSEPEVFNLNNYENSLKRNRTRGSRSGRPRRFPRSHSTGHSLVHPGEDTERFTLRLPQEVRKQILMNPALNRARSLVILPREGSSRRGYRTGGGGGGGGDGSSRGRSWRRLDRGFKSDRWVFTIAPPFLVRASSIRSPRVANSGVGDGSSKGNTVVPPAAAAGVAQLPV